MASKVLCDGSTVTWEPRWEIDPCEECESPVWALDRAEPAFHVGVGEHRDGGWYCSGCGAQMVDSKALAIILDRIRPQITKAIAEPNVFLNYLRRRRG